MQVSNENRKKHTVSFVLFMTNSVVFAPIFSRLREACSLAEERVGERELPEGFPYLNRVCVVSSSQCCVEQD